MQFAGNNSGNLCPLYIKEPNMRLLRITIPLLFFCACADEAPESRFDKMARAYCECTGKLVELNQQTEALATDKDAQESFQQNLRRIQDAYDKAKNCNAAIVAQFGKLKTAELDSLRISLATGQCPELSKQSDLIKEMLGE